MSLAAKYLGSWTALCPLTVKRSAAGNAGGSELTCWEHITIMQCRHSSKEQTLQLYSYIYFISDYSLDIKYLLYGPIFTDLNSLIIYNRCICSWSFCKLMNLSSWSTVMLVVTVSSLDRVRRETASLGLHCWGHPAPYATLAHLTWPQGATQPPCCKSAIVACNYMTPSLCWALRSRFLSKCPE